MASQIANVLKQIRLGEKLNQQEFAEKLNIKVSAYRMVETGKNNPTFELLLKIVEIFKINPKAFFDSIKDDSKIINNDYLNSIDDDYLISEKGQKKAKNDKSGVDLTSDELKQGLTKLIQSNLIYLEFHLSDILLNLKFLNEKITGKTFDRAEYDERSKSIKNMVNLLKDIANSGYPSNKGLFNFLLNSDEAIRVMLDGIREESKDLLLNSK